MRTTLDLPDDLLDAARSIARGRKQSLGSAVAELMRRGLTGAPMDDGPPSTSVSPRTGLPVIHLGRPTTLEDVQSLDDDE